VLKVTSSDTHERRRTPINLKMGKTMPGSHPDGGILDGQGSLYSVHPEMKIFVQDQGMRKNNHWHIINHNVEIGQKDHLWMDTNLKTLL